jgi:hypothetical protein
LWGLGKIGKKKQVKKASKMRRNAQKLAEICKNARVLSRN